MGNAKEAVLGDTEDRIVYLQKVAGQVLVPIGVAPLSDGPTLFAVPGSKWDWLVLRLEDDPLFKRGELAIPPRQRSVLCSLDKAGVTFDELLIAHEVPRGSLKSGSDLPKPDVEEVLLEVSAAPVRRLEGLVKAMALCTKAITALPLVVVAAVADAADPVLIGAITKGGMRNPGVLAAYFEVIRW
jgi:hypothetical protein